MGCLCYIFCFGGNMNISFLSDNTAPADMRILGAVHDSARGYELSYGYDSVTEEAERLIKREFGSHTLFFPVLTGTGANVISIASVLRPFEHVLCVETAHINADECGASERFAGSKLITVKSDDGKLTPQMLVPFLEGIGFEHHTQPKMVSISQTTETGTAYTPYELEALSEFTKSNNLILHVDGSRIANAAAHLGVSLAESVKGADIVSFGGTKNGMMIGEAVLFLNPALADGAKYVRKQYGQLFSKMRYISAQFIPYINDGIWLENAKKANHAARLLGGGFEEKGIRLKYPVQGNGVFALLDEKTINILSEHYKFYVWNPAEGLCRFMCPYTVTEDDIRRLLSLIA